MNKYRIIQKNTKDSDTVRKSFIIEMRTYLFFYRTYKEILLGTEGMYPLYVDKEFDSIVEATKFVLFLKKKIKKRIIIKEL